MPDATLGRTRLLAQGLIERPFADPHEAVWAHGAMQGQDLPGVLASAALRSTGRIDDVVAQLDGGQLVRAYPMRGTVFLMSSQDAWWVSQLCAAPALKAAARRRSQLGLEERHLDLAREWALGDLAERPLGLSRAELFEGWERELGLAMSGGRGYHLLAYLIGESSLVYGPWNGKDQNVVARAQWLPGDSSLERFGQDRTLATAELLVRYLTSHGPATVRDFAWWTKLPLGQILKALPLILDRLEASDEAEPSYWRAGLLDEVAAAGRKTSAPLLLPGFDEFILGYADRTFAMTPEQHTRVVPGNNGVFGRTVVHGGLVRGLWRAGGKPGKRSLEVTEFEPLSDTVRKRLSLLFEAFPTST